MTDYTQDFRERLRVVIESPYAGRTSDDLRNHQRYLHKAIHDSLDRLEAPIASHGFYVHYLDDNTAGERRLGIQCGYTWMMAADLVAFYTDWGMSVGMNSALKFALDRGIPVEMREIGKWI